LGLIWAPTSTPGADALRDTGRDCWGGPLRQPDFRGQDPSGS